MLFHENNSISEKKPNLIVSNQQGFTKYYYKNLSERKAKKLALFNF